MRDNEEEDEQKPDEIFEAPKARGNFNVEGGNHGAMVQEAKKLMAADDDDEPVANTGDEGPKIKMGRIGKKKKKGGAATTTADKAAADSYTKKIRAVEPETRQVGGGFSDSDIEFMKKAIQILCQSTLPLGKSIDFVTDDVDSMSKEYEHWRREAITCTQQLGE